MAGLSARRASEGEGDRRRRATEPLSKAARPDLEWGMLLALGARESAILLGAAKCVAQGGVEGTLSSESAGAIDSLARLGLRTDPLDLVARTLPTPTQLTAVLVDSKSATTSIELLAIMALIDGALDVDRIGQVLDSAEGVGLQAAWLEDLSMRLDDDLGPVIADIGGSQSPKRLRRPSRTLRH